MCIRDRGRVVQRRNGRRLQTGGDLAGRLDRGSGHVVVEQDVVTCCDDAEQATPQHPDAVVLGYLGTADEHRFRREDGVAEDRQTLAAQGRPGLHDIGDDVGHAEGDRRLDGSVETHDRSAHASPGQVPLYEPRVARRHPPTRDVGDVAHRPRAGGIPEGLSLIHI